MYSYRAQLFNTPFVRGDNVTRITFNIGYSENLAYDSCFLWP